MAEPHPHVLLAIGGSDAFEPPKFTWDIILAADHGADHLRDFNIPASKIIGDLDSISEDALAFHIDNGAKVFQAIQDKDQTDLELALQHVPPRVEQELFLVGVCGGRFDHLLMNIFTLSRASTAGLIAFDTPEGCGGILPPGQICIGDARNCNAGLLAQTPVVKNLCSQGVQWELYDETLAFGEGRGISNHVTESQWRISHRQGALLWLISGPRRADLEIEWLPAPV